MPGEEDFSSAFMPQQPINQCLIPSLMNNMNINMTTNPHKFTMDGISILGTSGKVLIIIIG
jgi:DNA polymerase II small subunit/DNA polymerase delta subunit B